MSIFLTSPPFIIDEYLESRISSNGMTHIRTEVVWLKFTVFFLKSPNANKNVHLDLASNLIMLALGNYWLHYSTYEHKRLRVSPALDKL